MRRALLALIVIAVAAPAVAGQARLPTTTKSPPPAQAPVNAPSVVLPAPIPLAVGRPGGDVTQCKATCARTLYFCQSSDDDSCGGRWAQCSAACTATYYPARIGR